MLRVEVNAATPYAALIGRGLLKETGVLLCAHFAPCRCLLAADNTVNALYGDTAAAALEQAGFTVCRYAFPPGEENKNLIQLGYMLEALASAGLTRGDIVVALGGGVTGDLAGLAAALYLRGIGHVNIPTTLLAAVDAAVGGKTAVNLGAGKNLAGAFHQPKLVICDCDTFATLPTAIWLDGLGECVKYAMLGDAALLAVLTDGSYMEDIPALVERCLTMKARLVATDERDSGARQLLNFGHTVGHAIERCSDYTVSHGQAVAIGMNIVTGATVQRGLCGQDCLSALQTALRSLGLPLKTDISVAHLTEAALRDKKRRREHITLVLPVTPGRCVLHQLPLAELEDFIATGLEAALC